MDSSFGYPHLYQPRSVRNFDAVSQATSALGVTLGQVDIPCPFHSDEQSSNYCIESKCHQPLCSECIEDHLLYHKKNGYSDLGIKSLRGLRKECIARLGGLIEELVHSLGQLEAPVPPEQQLQNLQNKLESVRSKMHEIIEGEFNRLKQGLRVALAQSANYFKSMAEIHSRLEDLIQQLRQSYSTLVDGGKRAMSIPECIKKTLTLDVEVLLQTFNKEGAAYEMRRAQSELDIAFQPQLLKNCLSEVIKIVAPQNLNTSVISSSSRLFPKSKVNKFEEEQVVEVNLLPVEAVPRGNGKFLHFFQTGSNKLHLISVENRKQAVSKIISINQFVVPSFHASLISNSGQFIFLSGGIVQLNGGAKSPLFIRYSIRTQTCKKDFAKVKPRSSHSLCQDSNGQIYILGGYGSSELSGGDPSYQMLVEKVNPRSGRVQIQTSSNWGGSNISMLCGEYILKACDEGIQLYTSRTRQWIIAQVRTKPRSQFTFFRNSGFACLSDSDVIVFGGYNSEAISSDVCFSWKITMNEKPRIAISKINCRLPIPEGFQNCSALIDESGFYVLQNVEDQQAEQQYCVDSERRLLRFNLHDGSGDFKVQQYLDQQ